MNDHRHGCPDGSRVTTPHDGAGGCAHRGSRPAVRLRGPDQSGSIVILVAVCLMVLIGATAMGLDLANLFLAKSLNQRIADQAALAAAFAYSQSSNSAATASTAASSMAVANGAGSAGVSTSIVASPTGDGSNAARVVVTSTVALSPFGKALLAAGIVSYNVAATAYAEIQTAATPCVIALATTAQSGTGINAAGSPVTATGCEIASNQNVTTSGGGTISASAIYAYGTISGSSITGTQHTLTTVQADPFASANVFSRMSTVSGLTAPSFPSVGSAPTGGSALATCNTANPTLTVASGTYTGITVGSGCTTITFTGGSSSTNISGGINTTAWTPTSSTAMSFAAGTYNINGISIGNASNSGSNNLFNITISTTGSVTFNIWSGFTVQGCSSLLVNGPATYNIQGGFSDLNYATSCPTHPTVVFNNSNGGNSTFAIAGGSNKSALTVNGNSATFPAGSYALTAATGCSGSCVGLTLGSSAVATFGNGSYQISASNGGISVGGSATLTIGSQIDNTSVFQITGITSTYNAINTSSLSTLTLGSFNNFDLNGAVNFGSSATLGAGTYTVNGAFNACSNSGSLSGTSVSIIASGAVCFQDIYPISLSAPTAITSATVGTASTIVVASSFASTSISTPAVTVNTSNGTTTLVGALYMPNGPLTVTNGGNLLGNGNCLQVIATSMKFSNDAHGLATTCTGLGGSSASISLVQ